MKNIYVSVLCSISVFLCALGMLAADSLSPQPGELKLKLAAGDQFRLKHQTNVAFLRDGTTENHSFKGETVLVIVGERVPHTYIVYAQSVISVDGKPETKPMLFSYLVTDAGKVVSFPARDRLLNGGASGALDLSWGNIVPFTLPEAGTGPSWEAEIPVPGEMADRSVSAQARVTSLREARTAAIEMEALNIKKADSLVDIKLMLYFDTTGGVPTSWDGSMTAGSDHSSRPGITLKCHTDFSRIERIAISDIPGLADCAASLLDIQGCLASADDSKAAAKISALMKSQVGNTRLRGIESLAKEAERVTHGDDQLKGGK
ncbi:MAG: hypothetical protein ACOX3G_06660 [Armatimonadota bacterium]|jgi:hypothetical protein